jgi:hypothetical protein
MKIPEISQITFDIKDPVLVIVHPSGLNQEQALYVKSIFENSVNRKFNFIMYKDSLGYYQAFDNIQNNSIYCATMSRKYGLELINDHIINKVYKFIEDA